MPKDSDAKVPANKMWGGRFESGPAAIMAEINASIGFDQKMARQDIAGSQALPTGESDADQRLKGARRIRRAPFLLA